MKVRTVEARRRSLGLLGIIVFRVRNTRWIPTKDRARILAAARPYLRQAIHSLRESRNALRVGDIERHEFLRDRALWHRACALIEFYQPYAMEIRERNATLARGCRDGAAATAEAYAMPELDDLIRGCLKRGERTRDYTKEWALAFNVNASTVRRHIRRIKARLAAG